MQGGDANKLKKKKNWVRFGLQSIFFFFLIKLAVYFELDTSTWNIIGGGYHFATSIKHIFYDY